eukprot:TRINITY_DN3032_c0_g1_i1.p1 TRINITY_DN3032_c0_g1~~TRINITY_DN3032_c0_g1_i1.p1  ORF type:complete len:130 (-),score=45.11 TRINITY_DN3032_c0_g1_i1:48-437(-)
MSHLMVGVVRARNLLNKDDGKAGDLSDPYAKVMCTASSLEIQKTNTVNDCLDPIWNALLLYELNSSLMDEGLIKVWVMDKDKWSTDDDLGQLILPIKDFEIGKQYDEWYPLTIDNKPCGEINLRIKVTP